MPHILKHDSLEVQIDLPGEGYNFSRFDWSGKLVSLRWRGMEFCGVERLNHPNIQQIGRGLYNEFDMIHPPGFAEAKVGDWFHKIGIGLLQKTSEHYHFLQPYPIRPATFAYEGKDQALRIEVVSPTHLGYAYRLEKTYRLEADALSISYRLENRGEKVLRTEEYNHNFLAINSQVVDENYRLELGFQPRPSDFEEFENVEQVLRLEDAGIALQKQAREPFFIGRLQGQQAVAATWTLYHQSLGIGIREQGNFKTEKINLWGWGHVISPELFHQITVQPGQTKSWSRRYDFYTFQTEAPL